jgi:dipeptidyl-peptidase 4
MRTGRSWTVKIVFLSVMLGTLPKVGPCASAQNQSPPTVAESSEFCATCTSQECDSFVTLCAARADHVAKLSFGSTVDDRDMVAAVMASPAANISTRDQRLRILVIGNIHSGECAGKEAILMLLREIAATDNHSWLKHAVLVFVPNYNADANDKMQLDNRPGQIGPSLGMGRRENSQGYDLNRDFIKIESPEATALVRLMHEFAPHLFIDCHTTNGSKHRYALTYDIPHNPATSAEVRNYLRQQMMPRITEALQRDGTATFYYGNFNPEHTQWATYGFEPRYSTEYYGLRGGLAILSEAYSQIPYKERIFATKAFVTACIDDAAAHGDDVRNALDAVNAPRSGQPDDNAANVLSLAAEVAAFPDSVMVRGYQDDQPHDYECQFLGDYRSTRHTTLPKAYLIPEELTVVTALLRRHGIAMSQLKADKRFSVEIDAVDAITRATRPFQGHLLQQVTTTRRSDDQTVPAGTWLVPADQQLSRLAGYILEAESSDGLVTWNVIEDHLAVGEDYPILRLIE